MVIRIVLAMVHAMSASEDCASDDAMLMQIKPSRTSSAGKSQLDRLTEAIHQTPSSAQFICLHADVGEIAPFRGTFAPQSGARHEINVGFVAKEAGQYCVENSNVALVQRAASRRESGTLEKAVCDKSLSCGEAITCVDGQQYPTTCGPANCDEPIGPCPAECDATLMCGQAISCVDGQQYPTTCGPANCDEPIGPCPASCDDTLACGEALTCVNGQQYPTTCGPTNCDTPIGLCPASCDESRICTQAITCVDGQLYPTGCGPTNCDEPIGPCPASCDDTRICTQAITCVDGQLYPTGCGPTNCDEPIGACGNLNEHNLDQEEDQEEES